MWTALVAGLANGHFNGDLAEQGNLQARRFAFASTGAEDSVPVAIIGTDEVAHVFDQTQDFDVHFREH